MFALHMAVITAYGHLDSLQNLIKKFFYLLVTDAHSLISTWSNAIRIHPMLFVLHIWPDIAFRFMFIESLRNDCGRLACTSSQDFLEQVGKRHQYTLEEYLLGTSNVQRYHELGTRCF